MDVRFWLRAQGLEEYTDTFSQNGVDAELLPELTNEDLKDLGIKRLVDRKNLLKAIALLSDGSGPAASLTKPAKPSQPMFEGDRRQLTIFFADLSGYTELSDALDAEELHNLVGYVFDAIDRIVKDHGGTVHRHIGDEVMALFGAPIAHSDDPFRAVCAAIETHKAMIRISSELGRKVDMHIGIACGNVIVAEQGRENSKDVSGYAVTGVAANLAARLNSIAGSGQTIISDAVYRAVENLTDCHALGETKVKGLVEPIFPWRLIALYTSKQKHSNGRFIGRHAEIIQFNGALEACRATQHGQAIFMRGEAGIGKSRLIEECETNAASLGFSCHKCLIFDFGVGDEHDALRTLVFSLLSIPPTNDIPAREAVAEKILAQGVCEPEQRVFLNVFLNLPLSAELLEHYDAMDNATRIKGKQALLSTLVAAKSALQARLLIVEDIHWADTETLADLAILATAVQNSPAVLVMSSRIDGDPLTPAWRSSSSGNPLLTLDIGALRKEEAAVLAEGFTNALDDFAKNCIERASGNPLFLEQLLRSTEEGKKGDVPATIQSLIMARIDRLSEPDKQALQAASVIGQKFNLDELHVLIEDENYTCDRLIDLHFARVEGGGYLFAHALIQESIYASLLKDKKVFLHKRAAEIFSDHDPILYAQHLDRADSSRAPVAYLNAASKQIGLYRYEQALRLIDRGLELAIEQSDKFELAAKKGLVLHNLGLIEKSIRAYYKAIDLAQSEVAKCRTRLGLAASLSIADRYEELLKVLEKAEEIARAEELILERAQIHHMRGNLYFPMGRIDECAAEHEKSLAFAKQANSAEAEASALGGVADANYVAGRMDSAFKYFTLCTSVAHKNGFNSIEIVNASMAGFCRLYLNQFGDALDEGLKAITAANKVGYHRGELLGEILTTHALYFMGDYDSARQHNARELNLSRQLGAPRFESQALLFKGKMQHLDGQRDLAIETMKGALEISENMGHGFVGPRIMSALAGSYDDPSSMRDALDKGALMLEKGSVSHNHLLYYSDAIDISLSIEDWDRAQHYVDALETFTSAEALPWSDFFVARGRALITWRRGQESTELVAELQRLHDEAKQVNLAAALPALANALAVPEED